MGDTLQPRQRWFHPTPDRLILALLATQVVLFLSERFRCPPFNQHKGLAVVIAVASVGAATLLLLAWLAASLLFRWRFQFQLRSLFVLTVAVAIACSWLPIKMKKAWQQEAIVAAIRAEGGSVMYDYEEPTWLSVLLKDEFFAEVSHVNFSDSKVTGAGLEHLKGTNSTPRFEPQGRPHQGCRFGPPRRVVPTGRLGPRRYVGHRRRMEAPQRADAAPAFGLERSTSHGRWRETIQTSLAELPHHLCRFWELDHVLRVCQRATSQ
jgi:hypothetical protein